MFKTLAWWVKLGALEGGHLSCCSRHGARGWPSPAPRPLPQDGPGRAIGERRDCGVGCGVILALRALLWYHTHTLRRASRHVNERPPMAIDRSLPLRRMLEDIEPTMSPWRYR